jgi:deoxyribonuclease V
MEIPRPEFRPDPDADRAAMEAMQDDIAATAVFEDAIDVDPAAVDVGSRASADGDADADADSVQGTLDVGRTDRPLVAGVDQAFLDGRVVSVIVVLRGREVVERAHAVSPQRFPYVPGLLSFREGGPILDAFEALETVPDLIVFDGSGRIHYRQAGLATHMGVALDLPAVGVAKNLLCGRPVAPTDELAAGERIAVGADGDVTAPEGTVIGYAVQTRQFDSSYRINPVYVSPGHRLSAETAADVVDRCRGGYKLPEPTRIADAYADEVKSDAG